MSSNKKSSTKIYTISMGGQDDCQGPFSKVLGCFSTKPKAFKFIVNFLAKELIESDLKYDGIEPPNKEGFIQHYIEELCEKRMSFKKFVARFGMNYDMDSKFVLNCCILDKADA